MKTHTIILAIFTCFSCFGQDLVTNGDFEFYTDCPEDQGFLINAVPWQNLALLSPDYYNSCTDFVVGVPSNALGYQPAHSGEAYAGIFVYQDEGELDVREYISIQLDEPLASNASYYVDFKINLVGQANFAIETMGVLFTSDDQLNLNGTLVDHEAQIVHSGEPLTDTLNWMTISGIYVAEGGEQYLTIGNFENDENCGLVEIGEIGAFGNFSYYYIDDVVVQGPISAVDESEMNQTLIYPNPVNDELRIESPNAQTKEIRIYNLNAELVKRALFSNSLSLNMAQLTAGLYYYDIVGKEGTIKRGKLLKE